MDYSKYTVETLNKLLLEAVSAENFETAAEIRDVINERGGNDNFMTLDVQVKIILDNINFEKIYSVMEFLDWKIAGKIPSTAVTRRHATKLLVDVWNTEEGYERCSLETGGLRAERLIYDGLKMLKLSFILTSWDIDYDAVTLTYEEYMGE
jgi:hypothetical protein